MGGYNPHKENISYFLNQISRILDSQLNKYENFIILGDFNALKSNKTLGEFYNTFNLKNLIKEPTCYKNIHNPSSIDVILTNRKKDFGNSIAIETGLSDHHKMVLTILKTESKIYMC